SGKPAKGRDGSAAQRTVAPDIQRGRDCPHRIGGERRTGLLNKRHRRLNLDSSRIDRRKIAGTQGYDLYRFFRSVPDRILRLRARKLAPKSKYQKRQNDCKTRQKEKLLCGLKKAA